MLKISTYEPAGEPLPVVGVLKRIGDTVGRYRRLEVEVEVAGATHIIDVLADRRVTDVPPRYPVSLIVEAGGSQRTWEGPTTPIAWEDVNTGDWLAIWEDQKDGPTQQPPRDVLLDQDRFPQTWEEKEREDPDPQRDITGRVITGQKVRLYGLVPEPEMPRRLPVVWPPGLEYVADVTISGGHPNSQPSLDVVKLPFSSIDAYVELPYIVFPPAYVKLPPVVELEDRIAIGRVAGIWFYLGPDLDIDEARPGPLASRGSGGGEP